MNNNNDSILKIDTIKNKNKSGEEMMSNSTTEEIEDLQTKNDVFLMSDDKKSKWDIRRFRIMNNYKLWLFLAIIVLVLLIIIIVI
jgi:hypothetical protein